VPADDSGGTIDVRIIPAIIPDRLAVETIARSIPPDSIVTIIAIVRIPISDA